MGITSFEIKLLEKVLKFKPDIENVMELGSQNLYLTSSDKPPFASEWYKTKKVHYNCIDLAGDNNAFQEDLAHILPEKYFNKFDLVTDFGTSEHVVVMEEFTISFFHKGHISSVYPSKGEDRFWGYYNCWLNKHKMLMKGGIMISVNPLTGHWPQHGYSYIDEKFYEQLAAETDYVILELGLHPASGNSKDGMNVYCIMRKKSDRFPDIETFQNFSIHAS